MGEVRLHTFVIRILGPENEPVAGLQQASNQWRKGVRQKSIVASDLWQKAIGSLVPLEYNTCSFVSSMGIISAGD